MLASLLTLLAAPLLAVATVDISQPSSQLWWVDNSMNTLKWTLDSATSPSAAFTVFLANSNTQLLTTRVAIFSIAYGYQYSLTVPATQWVAGTNYTIQVTDSIDPNQLLGESEPFELKPYGSAYPTDIEASLAAATATASGSGSAAGSATGSATGSAAASSSSTEKKSGAGANAANVVAIAAAGALTYIMV